MAFFSANASACVLIITFFCFSNVVCMDNLDTDFSCMTRDEIIEYYFHQGLMHKEIAAILLSVHAITASVRIVKRVLKNRLFSPSAHLTGDIPSSSAIYRTSVARKWAMFGLSCSLEKNANE